MKASTGQWRSSLIPRTAESHTIEYKRLRVSHLVNLDAESGHIWGLQLA